MLARKQDWPWRKRRLRRCSLTRCPSKRSVLFGNFLLFTSVNVGVFLVALFAFRFLLHAFLALNRERASDARHGDWEVLPEWALVLLAYPIFMWIALEGETVYDVSPD
jgi:hypothetical protein